MPATRRRRIVRRAGMAMAVIVLLLSGYVSSVATLMVVVGAGLIPARAWTALLVYTAPLETYWHSDLPGAELIASLMGFAIETGQNLRD